MKELIEVIGQLDKYYYMHTALYRVKLNKPLRGREVGQFKWVIEKTTMWGASAKKVANDLFEIEISGFVWSRSEDEGLKVFDERWKEIKKDIPKWIDVKIISIDLVDYSIGEPRSAYDDSEEETGGTLDKKNADFVIKFSYPMEYEDEESLVELLEEIGLSPNDFKVDVNKSSVFIKGNKAKRAFETIWQEYQHWKDFKLTLKDLRTGKTETYKT